MRNDRERSVRRDKEGRFHSVAKLDNEEVVGELKVQDCLSSIPLFLPGSCQGGLDDNLADPTTDFEDRR